MFTPVKINAAITRAKNNHVTETLKADQGLYLRITAKGTALWCGKTKVAGKTVNKTFGHYPDVSLVDARAKKNAWISRLRSDDNDAGEDYTLQQAYEDWAERKRHTIKRFEDVDRRARNHILPLLGNRKIRELTAYSFIKAWQYLEEAEQYSVLVNCASIIRQVAIFVQNTGRASEIHDLTHISQNYVRTKPTRHHPALPPDKLWEVFYELESKHCRHSTVWNALLTLIYTMSRTAEIAVMRWDWVDFENKVIHFPAEVMKMQRPHDVPMSRQLEALLSHSPRRGEYVFVSDKSERGERGEIHIKAGGFADLLSRYGLKNRQSAHGFRSVGAMWMAERGVNEEVAEACLAHASGSAVRRAYQRSELLELRRPVMQAWCDYVEQCRMKALEKVLEKAKSEL